MSKPTEVPLDCHTCIIGDECIYCESLKKGWDDYYRKKKIEEEIRIFRERIERQIREIEIEKEYKKKLFYEFWYYSLLFILTYEIFKGLIMYKLSTID